MSGLLDVLRAAFGPSMTCIIEPVGTVTPAWDLKPGDIYFADDGTRVVQHATESGNGRVVVCAYRIECDETGAPRCDLTTSSRSMGETFMIVGQAFLTVQEQP